MINAKNTFVLEVELHPGPPGTGVTGHIEHVLSGSSHDFDSSETLLRFIVNALAGVAAAAVPPRAGDRERTTQQGHAAARRRREP